MQSEGEYFKNMVWVELCKNCNLSKETIAINFLLPNMFDWILKNEWEWCSIKLSASKL